MEREVTMKLKDIRGKDEEKTSVPKQHILLAKHYVFRLGKAVLLAGHNYILTKTKV